MLHVDSGINHQPDGAPHFIAELPELRVRVLVHAKLFAEALGIQSPALDKRRVAGVLSEFRLALLLLGQGNLQMVSGNRFVQRESFHLPFRPRTQVIGVHKIAAGPASGGCARLIVGGGF